MAETWRVVLASGEVREVSVRAGHSALGGVGYFARRGDDDVSVFDGTQRGAVMRLAVARYMSVAEILAPGEPTRAELTAQLAAVTRERDDATNRAAFFAGLVSEVVRAVEPRDGEALGDEVRRVTRERDVLRAQQAPLLDAHDALVAAARAAGWTGAGATGAELVAWVRRGEREACAARCDAIYTARDDAARKRRTHGSRVSRDEDCVRLAGQAQGAAMCAEAIRDGGE